MTSEKTETARKVCLHCYKIGCTFRSHDRETCPNCGAKTDGGEDMKK